MAVRSLGWLGVRTPNAAAMTAFYRDVLQLDVILERPGATWFRLGDGTEVHVYGPDDADHDFFGSSPVAGFWVDSFRAARTALEVAGVEFIYAEPQRAEGRAWQHFRAPDGNVYEIIGPDDPGDGTGEAVLSIAEHPLVDGQQRGELLTRACRIPRLPGPVGEFGAGGQGVRVLWALHPLT